MEHDSRKGTVWRPWTVIVLAVINAVCFFLPDLFHVPCSLDEMLNMGGLIVPWTGDGEMYRLVTAAFLHFNILHLANNLLVMVLLGSRLERLFGRVKLLIIYLAGAVGANLFSAWYYLQSLKGGSVLSAGASGAVFALTGALVAAVLRGRERSGLTLQQMLIFAALSIYSGFASASVNNAAHLSGLVFGFLLGLALYPAGRDSGWDGRR